MKYFKIFITFTGNFAKLPTPLVKVINCNQFITFTSKFTNLPKRLGKSEKNKHFKQFITLTGNFAKLPINLLLLLVNYQTVQSCLVKVKKVIIFRTSCHINQ